MERALQVHSSEASPLRGLNPRWPLQIPPPMASQTPPGRTVGLCVIRWAECDARGGLFEAVAFALELEHGGAMHNSISIS